MVDINRPTRRDFLKCAAATGTCLMGMPASGAHAGPKNVLSADRMGVLVDTTACVGCRSCEWACKEAHGLPTEPLQTYQDHSAYAVRRKPDHTALSVVNAYPTNPEGGSPTYVKIQCMHCDHPACVSACIVGAFTKEDDGSVLWATDKCIGCRYCMVACPFQIPAFEYHEALRPDITKCDFCFARTEKGLLPACVEICPVEALSYAPRTDLIKLAREKLQRYPLRYGNRIFGEQDAGGTSWLYIAGGEFEQLGLPAVGTDPMPGTVESIQHGIFAYFVPPVMLYALLGALMWISKKRKEIVRETTE